MCATTVAAGAPKALDKESRVFEGVLGAAIDVILVVVIFESVVYLAANLRWSMTDSH